jgi:hypothetical protein
MNAGTDNRAVQLHKPYKPNSSFADSNKGGTETMEYKALMAAIWEARGEKEGDLTIVVLMSCNNKAAVIKGIEREHGKRKNDIIPPAWPLPPNPHAFSHSEAFLYTKQSQCMRHTTDAWLAWCCVAPGPQGK